MVSYYRTLNERLSYQLYYISILQKQSKTIDAMINRIDNSQYGGAGEYQTKLEQIRDRVIGTNDTVNSLDQVSSEAVTKLRSINEQLKTEIERFKGIKMNDNELSEATAKLKKSINEYKEFQDKIMQNVHIDPGDSITSWVYKSTDTDDFPYSDNTKLLAAYGSIVNDYKRIKDVIEGKQKDIDYIVAIAREQIEPTLNKIRDLSKQLDELMVKVRAGLETVKNSSSESLFDITIGDYKDNEIGYIKIDRKNGFKESYVLDSRESRVDKFIDTLKTYNPSILSQAIEANRNIIGTVTITDTTTMIKDLDSHIKMMNNIAHIPQRGGEYNRTLEGNIMANIDTLSALNSEMEKLSINIERYNRALNQLADIYKEYGTFVMYKLASMSKMSRESKGDVIYKNLTPETIKEYLKRTNKLLTDITIGANSRAEQIGRFYLLALKKVNGFLEHIDKHPKEGEAINFDSSRGRIKIDFILFNDLHKLIDGYHNIETVPAIKRKEAAQRIKEAEEEARKKADQEKIEEASKKAEADKKARDARFGTNKQAPAPWTNTKLKPRKMI